MPTWLSASHYSRCAFLRRAPAPRHTYPRRPPGACASCARDGAASGGLPAGDVYALAVHPDDGSVLFAGVYGAGVYRSDGSGGSWAAYSTGLTNADISALAIGQAVPRVLWAASHGGGVYVTRVDDGPASHGAFLPLVTRR